MTSQQKYSMIGILFCLAIGFSIFKFDIVFVLAAVLLLIMLGLMVLKPESTTAVILFVLYSNLTVVLIRFHGVPEIVSVSCFVLLILPILTYVFVRKQGWVLNNVVILMCLYLGVTVVSAVFSRDILESVNRLIAYFVEGIVLYFLILNAVRTQTVLRKAIWAVVLAGVMMGSISLLQELTGSYNNNFGGLAQAKESGIGTGEVDLSGDKVKRRRLSGPIGSKNRYAQIMVVLLPLALFRFWSESSRFLKLFGLAACIPILSGALLTFSRGAGLSILLVLIIMTLMRYIKVRHFILSLVVSVILVVVAIPDYIYRSYKTYTGLSSVASLRVSEADGAVRGRATVNLAALNIFLDHPLLGVGPGQTRLYTREYSQDKGFRRLYGTRRAHNMYLEELADTGVMGFALFMAMIVITLRNLAQARRLHLETNPALAQIATGFFLAIIAYLATAMFLHLSYIRFFWLLMAMGGATIQISKSALKREAEIEQVDIKQVNNLKNAALVTN